MRLRTFTQFLILGLLCLLLWKLCSPQHAPVQHVPTAVTPLPATVVHQQPPPIPIPTLSGPYPSLHVADRLAHDHLPYLYGSDDPSMGGLDCSGFVLQVYHQAYGITLPNEADKQYALLEKYGTVWEAGDHWSVADLKPGDLIFFSGPRDFRRAGNISHVMIYAGGHQMVGAQLTHVGYYGFIPSAPEGSLERHITPPLGKFCVFAYARFPYKAQAP